MKNFDPKEYVELLALRDEDIPVMENTLNRLMATYPKAMDLLASIMGAIGGKCDPPLNKYYYKSMIKLDFPITDRCNLGCASCSHFAPLAKDAPMIPLDELAVSIALLREKCVFSISEIFILGGEPLLYPELPRIIEVTRKLYHGAMIFLVTNMILLEARMRELAGPIKDNRIVVGYSSYELNARHIVNGLQICKDNDIPTQLFGVSPAQFYSYMKSEHPSYPAIMKRDCTMNKCLTLRGNYLYLCSPVTYLEYPNRAFGMNLSASRYDRIDIRDIEHEDEVMALAELPNPFCRHCDVENNHQIGWRMSLAERSEWFYDT